eukprot:CAMPEP_0182810298 /NCGR_PEP_ID=MMETSP0006_2-20121128/7653_1 /TAXON_ID=97485 /ORGANISM="Prymnesium parvum, Strain Texoma1" /LENGTH=165 /DNA_ID=CAMNT_0024936161 /DNA_START=778 /DNA_END=1275 /DNA_ORIENTATION=+
MTTVGYGDFIPKSALGRAIAAIACVTGIVLLALVVTLATDFLSLNGVEARAVRLVQGGILRQAEGQSAASLIQHMWRYKRARAQPTHVSSRSIANKLRLLHEIGKHRKRRQPEASIENENNTQARLALLEHPVLSRLAALEEVQARILTRLDQIASLPAQNRRCL